MLDNDLLLIGHSEMAQKVARLLHKKGVRITLITPNFTNRAEFELFSELLATHRYVATVVNDRLGMILNNLTVQNSIREAAYSHLCVPDMWVQFGSNSELMRELGLGAESIAQRILQELFAHDHRFISKRAETAVV